MSDDTPNGVAQASDADFGTDEDLEKTPLQDGSTKEAAPAGWQMPTPVFRQTSGYLPEGFEKQFGVSEQVQPVTEVDRESPTPGPTEDEPAEAGRSESADGPETVEQIPPVPEPPVPATAAIDIEPQPDVIADLELVEEASIAPAMPVKQKSVAGRIILTILALIVVATLTIIFAAVVWYLLTPLPESTIN